MKKGLKPEKKVDSDLLVPLRTELCERGCCEQCADWYLCVRSTEWCMHAEDVVNCPDLLSSTVQSVLVQGDERSWYHRALVFLQNVPAAHCGRSSNLRHYHVKMTEWILLGLNN